MYGRSLVAIAGLSLSCVSACASNLSFDDGYAETVAGPLVIKKDTKQPDRVLVGNELLLRGDIRHSAWFIGSAYPRHGQATLILLGFDTGDNSCRYLYRILQLERSKQPVVSSDFGNCEAFVDLDLPDRDREKKVKSRFHNGDWQLGFPSARAGEAAIWYRFHDGKIFEGQKEVKGPSLP